MKKFAAVCLLLMATAGVTGVAQAQWAYTSASVHLRAGPAPDYPMVTILPPHYRVMVHGCLRDYSWCDVSAGWDRGWLYAAYIYYPYRGTEVPIIQYGAQIGLAVLGFILYDYWNDHYRNRPFYHERDRWSRRPPPAPPPHVAPHFERRPQPSRSTPHMRPPVPPHAVPPRQYSPQPQVSGPQTHRPSQQERSGMQPPHPQQQRAPGMDQRPPPQNSRR